MRAVVVGCGYVGIELASQLADRGHAVTGVRRSDAGIDAIGEVGERVDGDGAVDAIRADATDPPSLDALPDADAVVFAASSGGRGAEAAREVYVDGLRNVIEEYAARSSSPDRLVYTSSTGVYGDHDGGWVDEETPIDPTTEKTRVLAEAERIALEAAGDAGIGGTVARFAGLYGPGRYRLERYVEGPVTAGYLNMVHRDDAAGAIRHLLETDRARGEPVVVVDDEPVDKHAFADWLADECGVPRPEKRSKAERIAAGDLSAAAERRIRTSKRCSNDRLRALGYEFDYPTFREGYRDAVRSFRATRE
ncbi:NAD(P)-dependent oxidoreductase [Halorubrum sp. Ib24]|uniref:NAD-dependent epimerase/dehydratase family protein n=1 Tax=unclassified Halorubrum TaxID=2642239 RepID=UPI000B98CD11|nr:MULTISPECIES: NAD-dependent epimerase/dehydratase family protein [unclassified Halorubrum]OYR42018.1 NAD(P)-dependent oxidoreductase [Halorubrum sp. Ib24]OYR46865.1 NAD(P)-dependent oxidoreductase [Halorubrum sp. Hd13]